MTPGQFRFGSFALATATFLVVATVTTAPVVAIAPAAAIGYLPRAVLSRRRAVRLREVHEAWPDGLRDLVAAISAGASLAQAVAAVAVSGPLPLRRAFARFPVLAPVVGVVPALELVKAELADPTSDRVLEVLILAHERGGQIVADILRDLARATREDVRTADEIETDALEQKMNARAVFVLPWVVLLLLTLRPGPIRDFYRSVGGAIVVAIGAAMSVLGMWAVARLGRQPLEERVFGRATEGDVA